MASDVVYFDHEGSECRDRYHRRCTGRWRGEINLGKDGQGKRIRRKASARSKAELIAKLEELRSEVDQGVQSSGRYTVSKAIDDWCADRVPDGTKADRHQVPSTRTRAGERYAGNGQYKSYCAWYGPVIEDLALS